MPTRLRGSISPRSICSLTLLLGSLLGCTLGAYEQETTGQLYSVQIRISAEPRLKTLLTQAVEAELRKLPDVRLAESGSDYAISVIALKVVTQSRKEVGATLSVLVTAPMDSKLRVFAEENLPRDSGAELMSITEGAVQPLAHWIETAASGEIRQVCRNLIKSFEDDVLSARRKSAVRELPR